jgi:hypothetical protein
MTKSPLKSPRACGCLQQERLSARLSSNFLAAFLALNPAGSAAFSQSNQRQRRDLSGGE